MPVTRSQSKKHAVNDIQTKITEMMKQRADNIKANKPLFDTVKNMIDKFAKNGKNWTKKKRCDEFIAIVKFIVDHLEDGLKYFPTILVSLSNKINDNTSALLELSKPVPLREQNELMYYYNEFLQNTFEGPDGWSCCICGQSDNKTECVLYGNNPDCKCISHASCYDHQKRAEKIIPSYCMNNCA